MNHEDEKVQAQHYLKSKNYYYSLLSPIQTKLSGVVQHAVARLGGGTTPTTAADPIPPDSAFRTMYYGYNEVLQRNTTNNNEYQPPQFQDDLHLEEDELLPFASTDSAPPKKIHRQEPSEEEHFFVVEQFQRPKDWGAVADLDCFFAVRTMYFSSASSLFDDAILFHFTLVPFPSLFLF